MTRGTMRPIASRAGFQRVLVLAMLACPGLNVGVAAAREKEPTRTITGRVVDETGKPVPGVSLGWFWSANGIPRDEQGKPWPTDQAGLQAMIARYGEEKLYEQIGVMEPHFMVPSAATDAAGNFSLTTYPAAPVLVAMDASRRRGALVTIEQQQPDVLAEPLVLRDLVRVHGKMACSDPKAKLKWTNVYVDIQPDAERRPLDVFRLMECSSVTADFSFLAPPGTYTLEVYSTEPEARIKNDVRLELDGGKADVDLGTLHLKRENFLLTSRIGEWQAKGDRGDYKKHVGRAPPPWFFADARVRNKNVQIADFRGKWVVLEFWNLSCTVCLKHDLPAWAAFYDEHRQQRDRFEILSICVDVDENLDSIAQVEKQLEPIVKHVWKGRDLPFPVLLDSRLKTWQSFGLDFMAQTLLVDPQGNLTAVVGYDEVRERLTNELAAPQ